MCLLRSRGFQGDTGGLDRARRSSAHKSRDNLSNTYTARNPYSCCCGLRSSAELSLSTSVAISSVGLLRPTIGARIRMPFSPGLTKRPSEFQVRIPATRVAVGFCKAPTHYPCFKHRHDLLSLPSALWPEREDGAKVFPPRTAPRSGGASQWRSASSPRMDAGRGSLSWDGDCRTSHAGDHGSRIAT